jgi:hypothetical protein
MLHRPEGATIAEVQQATGWQAHSVRAALTGLKKKSFTVASAHRGNGTCTYPLVPWAPPMTRSSPGAGPAIVPAEASYGTLEAGVRDPLIEQIGALEALGIKQLRRRWREAYSMPSPPRSRREFLIRGLAHRLQEDALGGLAPAQRRRLARLAVALERDGGDHSFSAPRIKPGTRLIRQWRGAIHQVTVLENGFAYRGERYLSLSAIARTITGSRWSGPTFFGLKTRPRRNRKTHG